MKKLFTIAIGILLFAPVFGQKDIEFKLLSPTNGQDVYVNEPFNLIYSFKNVGNDWIDFDDSFFVSLKIDGDYLFGSFNKMLIGHKTLRLRKFNPVKREYEYFVEAKLPSHK